jgi:hypothetical protein
VALWLVREIRLVLTIPVQTSDTISKRERFWTGARNRKTTMVFFVLCICLVDYDVLRSCIDLRCSCLWECVSVSLGVVKIAFKLCLNLIASFCFTCQCRPSEIVSNSVQAERSRIPSECDTRIG